MKLKNKLSPILLIGLSITSLLMITNRFITSVPDLIAIPLSVIGLIFIIIGGYKSNCCNNNIDC